MAIAASASILALTACNQAEPTAPDSAAKSHLTDGAPDASSPVEGGVLELGQGRAMTPEEIARLQPSIEVKTVPPAASAPLAKAAAATCIVDFNQSSALGRLADHGYSTFVTAPWYQHQCYGGNHFVNAVSINLDHFHLNAENTNQCYGTPNKYGVKTAAGCQYQSDAMYWPRFATNMNGTSGIVFTAQSNGTARSFNLVAVYVKTGAAKVVAFRPGIGWWVWYGLTAKQRWYWPANTAVTEARIFDNADNGTYAIDNLEVQIN